MKTSGKLTRGVAAATLVLPLAVTAVAAPAAAATVLADWRRYPPGYGSGFSAYTSLDTSEATAQQSTGVVEISTTLEYGAGQAAGSGILIGSDGLVVTNHHVVQDATAIEVTDVSTGRQYAATVLGYDASRDVAVLQLQGASGLAAAPTDPGGASLGSSVTAVGDAGGDGGSLTAAPGEVTDLHHPISVRDDLTGAKVKLHNLIQVSSDVVPGDSGGALLTADGDVVGMNVAASVGGSDVTGYVIPIGRVLRVVDAVLAGDESGSVVVGGTPFLGVQLTDGSATIAGVVEGSPAAGLGLAAGDAVTGLDGTGVSTADQLRTAIAGHQPGGTVTVTWTDGSGASHSGQATLATGPVG
jgi:S1-C subfamily serine protease